VKKIVFEKIVCERIVGGKIACDKVVWESVVCCAQQEPAQRCKCHACRLPRETEATLLGSLNPHLI
jgi:hypothetical protein